MAAQGKMPEADTGAGARREAAPPSAYGGGIEACRGRLVVLAKPLPSGAGYYYQPFAVVRFEDLPEELRRQIAGASAHGAGAAARPRDPNAAPVAAPLRGEGVDARRYHATLPVDVVPEGHGLRRQLPGLVSSGPNDEPAVKFAGDGSSGAVKDKDYSERRILRLTEEDGKVVVPLDASSIQVLSDTGGSLFLKEKGFSHALAKHSGDEVCAAQRAVGAFYDNGVPAREDAAPVVVALLLGDNGIAGPRVLDCSNGLTSLREDAVPFVTEQGFYYHYAVLPLENVVPAATEAALRALRPPTYAVQVAVDAAAGCKAGDPTAAGVKAAGAGAAAGHEQDGSLSAVLGIVVASSAATVLAAGTVGPATAFGLFAALIGGLSLAMASVRGSAGPGILRAL